MTVKKKRPLKAASMPRHLRPLPELNAEQRRQIELTALTNLHDRMVVSVAGRMSDQQYYDAATLNPRDDEYGHAADEFMRGLVAAFDRADAHLPIAFTADDHKLSIETLRQVWFQFERFDHIDGGNYTRAWSERLRSPEQGRTALRLVFTLYALSSLAKSLAGELQ